MGPTQTEGTISASRWRRLDRAGERAGRVPTTYAGVRLFVTLFVTPVTGEESQLGVRPTVY